MKVTEEKARDIILSWCRRTDDGDTYRAVVRVCHRRKPYQVVLDRGGLATSVVAEGGTWVECLDSLKACILKDASTPRVSLVESS